MARMEKPRSMDRQATVKALRANQKREERRRKLWIYGAGSVALLAVIVTVTLVFVVDQQNNAAALVVASQPVAGVQSFSGLSRNHTTSHVVYPQNPPVGGDHSPTWLNCGTYTTPVNIWEAVHSMEHGAVWVTYRPDLPQQQIDALAAQAASHPYELLTPYPGLPSPVVASAWGKQLKMNSADDPQLSVFLQKYLQGAQTPEPGAPCTGGAQG